MFSLSSLELIDSFEKDQTSSARARKIARRIVRILGRILVILAVLGLCLPVALLPFSTSVPTFVWVILFAIDIVLLFQQFFFSPTWLGITINLVGAGLVGLLAVLASQAFARTPPITDETGKVIPGSFVELIKVNLNGSQQWVSIRGYDVDNPVLLFLAGGPGGSQLVTERRALGELEKHFVVVNWEQPGSGKSFDAVDRSTLTPERYIRDARELVLYLRQRFDEDKIYVLGESWGSALGIWMVQRDPSFYHAFIGTGQMVAFLETDRICYEFALNWAQERGDFEKVDRLLRQGPPPYYGEDTAWKESAFLMDTYTYMNQDPAIADDGFNTFDDLAGSEYGLLDKVNWFRGALDTLGIVYPQLWEVDFRQQALHLETPVFFLIGRHDVNAPPALTEAYYELLDAPYKQLVWFERSGHNPWVTESAAFVDVMVNTVLAQTLPSR